jgi:16S rRNA (cytosine967-C5)-methyltransferase
MRRLNEAPESAVRINSLIRAIDETVAQLPVPSHPAPGLPEGVVLDRPFDVQGSELWHAGSIMAQSRASMLVARIVAPRHGARVLDLCAAPGGKTTHLAALMEDQGEIVAVERHPGRARALEETCRRMRATCVRVRVQDATTLELEPTFDHVLLDPPCSGLGTLQSRPDRRWRASPESVAELASLQAQLLGVAAAATSPGGTLVYSVCTISRRESAELLEGFLEAHPEWEVESLGAKYPDWQDERDSRYLQLFPDRDLTDGFFIARLRRA